MAAGAMDDLIFFKAEELPMETEFLVLYQVKTFFFYKNSG